MVAGGTITVLLESSDRQLDAYGGDAPLRHQGVGHVAAGIHAPVSGPVTIRSPERSPPPS